MKDKEKATSIFKSASEMESEASRREYLSKECGPNTELRAEVESLLRDHQEQLHNEQVVEGMEATATVEPTELEQPGASIGPYKLLQQIGDGGMGVVYMAEQSAPVRRKVALKVIKPGMDTKEVVARFEAERQALALMNHPNVAKVLDAGETGSGRPYFVMELVHGVPITDFCDEQKLTTEERLRLFIDVCHAIQHAHLKGIIHRDIKPSNVMVTLHDDKAVPKVIDFGISKALSQQLTEKTLFTAYGQMVGTPIYMSPEQAQLSGLDVDTRSDVYSLGVMLYELLTGSTPFDKDVLKKAGFDEMRRIIREDEPPRPSARISTLHAQDLSTVSERRQVHPRRLGPALRGELDWIVMRALEKDRTRRYESASSFADDVLRFINNEPVDACPPALAYRLRKFAHRHRAAAAVCAGLTVALILSVTFGLLALNRHLKGKETELALTKAELEKRESDLRANSAERRMREIEEASGKARIDALIKVGMNNSSGSKPDFDVAIDAFTKAITARPEAAELYLYRGSVLHELGRFQESVADLNRSLKIQPDGNSAAHWLIAEAYDELDQKQQAEHHRSLVQEKAPDSPEAMMIQAVALGRTEKGLDLLNKAVAKAPFNAELVHRRGQVAAALAFRLGEKRFYDLGISDLKKVLLVRAQDPVVLWDLCFLVQVSPGLAEPDSKADQQMFELVDAWLKRDPNDVRVLWLMSNALLDSKRKDSERVVALATRGLEQESEHGGLMYLRAAGLWNLKRRDEAIEWLTKSIKVREYAYKYSRRAQYYALQDKPELAKADIAAAEKLEPAEDRHAHAWRHILTAYRILGDQDLLLKACNSFVKQRPKTYGAYVWRGRTLRSQGKHAKAALDFAKAVEIHPTFVSAHMALGECLAAQGKTDEAFAAFQRGTELRPEFACGFEDMGQALARAGDLQRGIAALRKSVTLKPQHASHYHSLGVALEIANRWQEAADTYRSAIDLFPKSDTLHGALGTLLTANGEFKEGDEMLQKAIALDPDDVRHQLNLGSSYLRQKRRDEALMILEQAVKQFPKHAGARRFLGTALFGEKSGMERGLEQLRLATQLKPMQALSFIDLAMGLRQLNRWPEARDVLLEGIEVFPTSADLHGTLATTLMKLGDTNGAIAALRSAAKYRPTDVGSHMRLADALQDNKMFDEAIQAYREAIRIQPKMWVARYQIGLILVFFKRDSVAAEEAFRETLRLAPDNPKALCLLGFTLFLQNKHEEGLNYLERGHEAGSKQKGWTVPSDQWIAACKKAMKLNERLESALSDKDDTTKPSERIELGVLAYRKQKYVVATKLFERAFALEASLLTDLEAGNRYNAACCATLAGAGMGDGGKLDGQQRARLIDKAIRWLETDLAAWRSALKEADDDRRKQIIEALEHWLVDMDLAPLREVVARKKLSAEQQKRCETLWTDLKTVIATAHAQTTDGTKPSNQKNANEKKLDKERK